MAALCAEERRRRTHYVQKIADNARRLRQSPRHVHNVAAKKVNEHVMGHESGSGGDFWEEQAREDQSREEGGKVKGLETGHRLVRASELPSVVERGYKQVTRDHKRVRRRGPSEDRTSQDGVEKDNTKGRTLESAIKHTPYRPLTAQRGEPRDRFMKKSDRDPPLTERFKIRPKGFTPVIHPCPSFQTKQAAELLGQPKPPSVHGRDAHRAAFRHDAAMFFQSVPWTSSEMKTESSVASCLLRYGLRHECVVEVRQLVSWKLANDRLTEEDVNILPEAYLGHKPSHRGLLDIFELFAELFQSEAFQKLPEQLKLSSTISCAAESMLWDIELPEPIRANRLLKATLRSSRRERIDSVIGTLCDHYLATGQPRKAYNAIAAVRLAAGHSHRTDDISGSNRRWKKDYEKVTNYAMKHGQLKTCQRYIALLIRAGDDPDRIVWTERFLQECRRREAYLPARPLLFSLLERDRWKDLNDQAKVDLAIAISASTKQDLHGAEAQRLFHGIPEALRGPVVEAWCAARLQTFWQTQRSLPAVWAEYERTKMFQSERFGTSELTLIEICNKANQPDQALRLLASSLQQEAHNAASLCTAAVSMARKSAWRQLRGLMDIIAESGKFVNDASTSRNLNSAIDIYSRHHTAVETWKFVTDMIANIGFAPNKITTDIMLQCFVSKKTLNMIPQWLRYLRTIGSDSRMSSTTATKLFSRFYFDQRPPHVLLVWFGRNLFSQWRSFDSAQLKDLIRTSIGYDLRKLPVQDTAALRERAERNLSNLEASGRGVPAPYRPTFKTEAVHVESNPDRSADQEEEVGDQSHFQFSNHLKALSTEEAHMAKSHLTSTDSSPKTDSTDVQSPHSSTLSSRTTLPGTAAPESDEFQDLRPQYHMIDPTPGEEEHGTDVMNDSTNEPGYVHEDSHQARVVKDMVLALSLRQYSTVLDLYKDSLSSTGLPISPLSLELATEATIRLDQGDMQEATAMIDAAKEAGMEVRRAMGPLLVHRIHSLDSSEKKDANALRIMVIDYYRTNEENGFPVKHHVGITAANTLINNHRADHGVNILNAIYHSEWVIDRPLDIVAMTVYLKGYAALKSKSGIQWVLRKVLSANMAIDRPFLAALKDACRSFGIAAVVRRTRSNTDRTGFIRELRLGRQQCIVRRHEQRIQTKRFGNSLVKRILQCVEMERRLGVEMEKRRELEESFFGGPVEGEDGHEGETIASRGASPNTANDMAKEKDFDGKPTRLEARRARARLAMAIRFQGEERTGTKRTLKQTRDSQWLKQYRALTKKDLIMADGKLASFRRFVA